MDLDEDTEHGIRVIETICQHNPSTTVMACSAASDLTLARRAMQSGARDFLAEPVSAETVKAAFDHLTSRRTVSAKGLRATFLSSLPSKRGVGVTSIATNFAVALARRNGRTRVGIVDMDLQLGDVSNT